MKHLHRFLVVTPRGHHSDHRCRGRYADGKHQGNQWMVPRLLETPVQLRVGALEINKNMLLWINDALMAVFFLLIGLEVKRELMQGSLASLRQAAFPIIAAIGA